MVRTEEFYFLLSDSHQQSQHTAGEFFFFFLSIINSVPFHIRSRVNNSQRALQETAPSVSFLIGICFCFCFEKESTLPNIFPLSLFSFVMEMLEFWPKKVSLAYLPIKTVSDGGFHKGFPKRESLFPGNWNSYVTIKCWTKIKSSIKGTL